MQKLREGRANLGNEIVALVAPDTTSVSASVLGTSGVSSLLGHFTKLSEKNSPR
jgi:hypothetical protein